MKIGFYPKLAMIGISKNRKIYIPYILTCAGMVMMYYIVSFLSLNKAVSTMPGGVTMQAILMLGCGVIGFFSLIFLFYTNSFLIRKRKREFGLYNILGMGKRNLGRILFWESLMIAAVTLVGGLLCGILFSKIGELFLAHMLGGKVVIDFSVGSVSVIQTLVVFAVIFLLILLNSLRQIHVSKPVELLHSDTVGEKPPKSNWVLAVLGIAVLAGAYYIALSIKNPISALIWFFVAVIMVILATYLLFIAGSVVLCRLLQKNKQYYYSTGHFVSVSSMIYRMKRNGAGLASICILSTMVLVMISSTTCLYAGTEDSLRSRYPRNIVVDTYSIDTAADAAVKKVIGDAVEKYGAKQENMLEYRYLDVSGYFKKDQVLLDQSKLQAYQLSDYANIRQMFILPLEDYNRLAGTNETLTNGQVLLHSTKTEYTYPTITLEGGKTMTVKKTVSKFVDNGVDAMQIVSSLYIIVPDIHTMEDMFALQAKIFGKNASSLHAYYGFDLSCESETQTSIAKDISDAVEKLQSAGSTFPKVSAECVARDRTDIYALYGGFFCLGILLGIVFIFGAVLIMYYKQITEGYEDQSRFDIMQKVGMTKKEIQKSIDSQVLTVFFLPLVTAGVHVAFAFRMISKLLALFNLTNTRLLIIVTAVSFLVFALFYVLVYFLTSRAYYSIVSGRSEQ